MAYSYLEVASVRFKLPSLLLLDSLNVTACSRPMRALLGYSTDTNT